MSNEKPEQLQSDVIESVQKVPFFKLSLAQWSLHRSFRKKEKDLFQFAPIAKEMGFEGVEYVSMLYLKEIKKLGFDKVIDSLNAMSELSGVRNVLIMVDEEGDLASPDEADRNEAVENHKKWVDAGQRLGCHSIRVNLRGSSGAKEWEEASVAGLSRLAGYAADKHINIIVENHGGFSSNAAMLVEVIQEVHLPNVGVLPDFGNFCMEKNEDNTCAGGKDYNRYKGVEEMMPMAKGVSAKSYDFDEKGNETKIDYYKMLQIVKNSGYSSYIGVEYEGDRLSEEEGTLATKALLLNAAESLK
ncbi:sugar phosphate isomerase/epimerase family protein [Mariniflexile sp. HMF6888]|uniref:sugar phosphate isomerase/epimerase family protein n=1 Tax=Mariniflexile sp. HMF6888 TaxID=3373086 RepID=UPI0037A722E0